MVDPKEIWGEKPKEPKEGKLFLFLKKLVKSSPEKKTNSPVEKKKIKNREKEAKFKNNFPQTNSQNENPYVPQPPSIISPPKGSFFKYAVLIILSILFFLIVLKPPFLGWGVYNENDTATELVKDQYTVAELGISLQELREELQVNKEAQLETLRNKVSSVEEELTKCNINWDALENSNNAFEEEITTLKQQITEKELALQLKEEANVQELLRLQEEITKLNSDHNELTKNAAKNICCKRKVDEPSINSYSILENKIVCTNNGEEKLECY